MVLWRLKDCAYGMGEVQPPSGPSLTGYRGDTLYFYCPSALSAPAL